MKTPRAPEPAAWSILAAARQAPVLPDAARPVKDGAASVIWAALIPDDGPTGGFFRNGKVLGW
jgi:hypothetical protein